MSRASPAHIAEQQESPLDGRSPPRISSAPPPRPTSQRRKEHDWQSGVNAGGNARPWAEANIAHDPGAAAAVLGAAWSSPPLMVGLDVTHRATLTRVELDLLDRRRSPAAAFLRGPLQVYRRAASTFCAPGETPCHDDPARLAPAKPLNEHSVIVYPDSEVDGRQPHEATAARHFGGEAFLISLRGGGTVSRRACAPWPSTTARTS